MTSSSSTTQRNGFLPPLPTPVPSSSTSNPPSGSSTVEETVRRLIELSQNPESRQEFESEIRSLVKENEELKRQQQSTHNDDLHFTLDSEPDPVPSSSAILYDREDRMTVLSNDPVPNEESNALSRSVMCFNCEGDHMLTECPKPKDYRRIAQNRKEHSLKKVARYHLDPPQKYAHVKPGGLPSKRLRQALGLNDDQLPGYIYKMRELGYPPGWLKEAEIAHSGVNMYVADAVIPLRDIDDEDGEIVEESSKIRYDTTKLVTWHGFNEEINRRRFRDETNLYNAPPVRKEHLMSEMLKQIKPLEQRAYIRGEMQDTNVSKRKRDENDENGDDDDDKDDISETKANKPEPTKTAQLRVEVLSKTEGTPVLQSYSSYESLPSQEKWAKDTTDHILFENLPDSTGKYEQVLKVLKKARKTQ